MRPEHVAPVTLEAVAAFAAAQGLPSVALADGTDDGAWQLAVTGLAVDSRSIEPGDLYVALPGAQRHGAQFTAQAAANGAAAVLTDPEGLELLAGQGGGLPVLRAGNLRALVGPLAAEVFQSRPADGSAPTLFGVTGTNGKTTTTYFINSLLRALGKSTGLIGTIEINAGGEPIPSVLTTPESPQVHGLLALMRERGLDAAAMEVSSHAISYRRVDGVRFDVAGFTNLTQDHLDLHGTMEDYFAAKAALFQPDRARTAVIAVDDEWGRKMAAAAGVDTLTVRTVAARASVTGSAEPDWTVEDVVREGLGHSFRLQCRDGRSLAVRTGLPGTFNVSNAAVATLMVLAGGTPLAVLQRALAEHDPFTVEVPGRMQLICEAPAGIVDFAHNPDALQRTLESVRQDTPGSRVIAVFGATGQRDQTKRPVMGAIAARLADVVIITDDDPHDEDDAAIRADVLRGALQARDAGQPDCEVLEIFPRAAAIERAAAMARPADTILVAGRGHEVWQEVKGVNLALDDRVELREALIRHGFSVVTDKAIES